MTQSLTMCFELEEGRITMHYVTCQTHETGNVDLKTSIKCRIMLLWHN